MSNDREMKGFGSGKRLILPIFITHQGCRHRCVFCNQEMTTAWTSGIPPVSQVQDRIVSFLRTINGRRLRREVAFYGGTFTALSLEDQERLLGGVRPFIDEKRIDGIRVSTRPDAVDIDRLDLLMRYDVQTVEVGVQSMVDEILWNCRRGHTSKDVIESVRLIRSLGFELGLQLMLGLPGEDKDCFLTTVRRVVDLVPDFVRIYPLLVLRGAPLERFYQRGVYAPISLEEAVQWAKGALELLEQVQIPVIRMGLQATPSLEKPGAIVAGPYHPAFRSLVESAIFYDMACRLLEECNNGKGHSIRFRVAPGDLSNLQGERRQNLARLKKGYGLKSVEIVSDPEIPRGRLLLETPQGPVGLSRNELWGARNLSCS